MLDDLDRAYFAQRLLYAQQAARDAKDERAARPYRLLAAEYQRELNALGPASSDCCNHGAI